MVQFELSAEVHALSQGLRFDDSVLASEVSIVGVEGAVISLPSATSERRRMSTYNGVQAAVVLSNHKLKIQVHGVVFQGSASSKGIAAVLVESGELIMTNSTVRDVQGTRALHANGGSSTIRSSRFEANLGGAISATSGTAWSDSLRLILCDSALVRNEAEYGGALAVEGSKTKVAVVATRIEGNSATVQGGGLHVTNGTVMLANRTVLEGNSAPEGAAMQLLGGHTSFALPAPPGRWVNNAKWKMPGQMLASSLSSDSHLVSGLGLGSEDEDYPFACPPGDLYTTAPCI
jgi:hypothetical protein